MHLQLCAIDHYSGLASFIAPSLQSCTNGKSGIMARKDFFIQGGSVASSLQMNSFLSTEHWRYITESKLHSESGATASNCAERWWQLQNIQSICIWLRKNGKWSVQAEQIWKPCELIYNTPLPYICAVQCWELPYVPVYPICHRYLSN